MKRTWAQFGLGSLLIWTALIAAFFAGRKSHERFPDIVVQFIDQTTKNVVGRTTRSSSPEVAMRVDDLTAALKMAREEGAVVTSLEEGDVLTPEGAQPAALVRLSKTKSIVFVESEKPADGKSVFSVDDLARWVFHRNRR